VKQKWSQIYVAFNEKTNNGGLKRKNLDNRTASIYESENNKRCYYKGIKLDLELTNSHPTNAFYFTFFKNFFSGIAKFFLFDYVKSSY